MVNKYNFHKKPSIINTYLRIAHQSSIKCLKKLYNKIFRDRKHKLSCITLLCNE